MERMTSFEDAVVEFQRRIREKGLGDLKGSFIFNFGQDNLWILRPTSLDGKNSYEFVKQQPSLCCFKATPETFLDIINDPTSVMQLFIKGKLKVDNMANAAKFAIEVSKLLD